MAFSIFEGAAPPVELCSLTFLLIFHQFGALLHLTGWG
jgi:hypothetical protein